MTTLMRNGRDRRLGKPVKCHARKERVFLVGTRSADHIRASGHSGCIQRPDTWLHPNASLKSQIPLAPRAPSIHGTLDRIHHALYEQCREQDQRNSSPTAAIIDSQSVKSAEKGGPASIRRVTMRARRSRARSGIF